MTPRAPQREREDLRLLTQKLAQSEAYFRAVIGIVSELITITDADGLTRYISPSVRTLLGYEPEERIGRQSFELVHPDDADRVRSFMAEAIACRRPAALVAYRYRHRDGSWRQLESSSLNLLDDPAVSGIVVRSRDITDLVEIEGRYHSLFENMVDGLAHCRMLYDGGRPCDCIFLHVNRAFEAVTGLTEAAGRKLSDLVQGVTATNAAAIEAFDRVVTTGASAVFESYVPALERWFSVSSYRSGPGEFIALFHNITERKRAEDALLEREAFYRSIFENMSDGMFMVDVTPDHRFRIAGFNPAEERLVGLTNAEVTGRFTDDVLPPELAAAVNRNFAKCLAACRPVYYEEELAFREVPKYFSTTLIPVEGLDGTIRRIIGIASDITERKRTEERLLLSEAEYRGLVEHAPLGIYRATPEGEFLTVNPALVAMLGCESGAELLNLNLERDIYVNAEDRALLKKAAARQRERAIGEMTWRRKDGRHISVRVQLRPVRKPTGEVEYFDGLAEDVTEQRSLARQFLQAQRMEAVGQLAGGVAHDFNNLLTAIIGYSDLLGDQLTPDDPRRGDLHEIRAAADRATDLTRQLLAFSRKQVLKTRVVDLNTIVLSVDKMLRRLIGEDVTLEIGLSETPATVRADPGQVEQVVLNLAVNARDAMPRGGKLLIETAHVDIDQPSPAAEQVRLAPGPYVLLAVTDTGIGMDAETQTHIFEPFFTTKEQGRGTGLGLSTVYGIVKQSEGYIWTYSEPGHGTTFKVYLPRVDEAPERTDKARSAGEVLSGRETVLVAEDDAKVRDVVQRVLSQNGYTLLVAQDGAAALAVAGAHPGSIDLLVTDLVMPGMNGRALAKELKAQRPDVRVLFTSGYTDDAVFRHGLVEDDVHYLQKPFTGAALARKVREVLDA